MFSTGVWTYQGLSEGFVTDHNLMNSGYDPLVDLNLCHMPLPWWDEKVPYLNGRGL